MSMCENSKHRMCALSWVREENQNFLPDWLFVSVSDWVLSCFTQLPQDWGIGRTVLWMSELPVLVFYFEDWSWPFSVTSHRRAACQAAQRQRWRGRGGRWGRWWTSWSSSRRQPGFSEMPSTLIWTKYHCGQFNTFCFFRECCTFFTSKSWLPLSVWTKVWRWDYIEVYLEATGTTFLNLRQIVWACCYFMRQVLKRK